MSRSSQRSHRPFWSPPQDILDVGDSLENIAALTAFLAGTIGSMSEPSGEDIGLSNRGQHGLWIILSIIEEQVDHCNEIISETKIQAA